MKLEILKFDLISVNSFRASDVYSEYLSFQALSAWTSKLPVSLKLVAQSFPFPVRV